MIGEIEDAIITRLQAAFGLKGDKTAKGALPYKVPTIESYGGQIAIDESGRPAAIATFTLPALFISNDGLKLREVTGERSASYEINWTVFCCTYNTRNERSQRQGDENEVGTYQLSEDVAGLLGNQRCGQNIKPLRLTEIANVFSAARNDAKAISVRTVHLRTTVSAFANYPEGTELADVLLEIGNGFYLPKIDDDGQVLLGQIQDTPVISATVQLPAIP